jgi:alcohol dehydrogenase, propanol-preferring
VFIPTYRVFQVTGQRQFELVERDVVEPGFGQVRVRVLACGVCHSDFLGVEGTRPDPSLPVVPGHEIVGVVDAVGLGVTAWRPGDRVGIGFLGGHCGQCTFCRRGDFVNCAGITTFNALRKADAPPGALVAIQGIGGLGHLGVQFAKELGYRTVAIARGGEKADLATALGADEYIDSTAADAGAALQELGGAAVIVATAASGASMTPLLAGLAPRGQLVVVGVANDPISVSTVDLTLGGRSIVGSLTGTPIENEDNLAFSAAHGVKPMKKVMPLEDAPKAYDRMISGAARFRVVLDIGSVGS